MELSYQRGIGHPRLPHHPRSHPRPRPQIDEQTLADTVEGLTDLHEILSAIIRAALTDQALATGLEGRIGEMEARRDRLQDRAAKRRQIAKDVMVELDLKLQHRQSARHNARASSLLPLDSAGGDDAGRQVKLTDGAGFAFQKTAAPISVALKRSQFLFGLVLQFGRYFRPSFEHIPKISAYLCVPHREAAK
jgi:hypothetical protein